MDHNTNHDGNTSLQLCRLSCSVWSTNCHSRFLFKFDLIHAIKPTSKNLFLILTLYENSQFKKPFFMLLQMSWQNRGAAAKGLNQTQLTTNKHHHSKIGFACASNFNACIRTWCGRTWICLRGIVPDRFGCHMKLNWSDSIPYIVIPDRIGTDLTSCDYQVGQTLLCPHHVALDWSRSDLAHDYPNGH